MIVKFFFGAGVLAMFISGAATASTIDFEDFGNGDLVTRVASSDGAVSATISAIGGANEARIFDTNLSATADPDLEAPFRNTPNGPTLAPGNVLIIQESARLASAIPDDNRSGGVITFDFDGPIDFTGFTILDDADITVTSNLGHVFSHHVTVDHGFALINLPGAGFRGIRSLSFDFNGASGGIDSLSVAAVPLPASAPALLVGLAGLALVRRRKSAKG